MHLNTCGMMSGEEQDKLSLPLQNLKDAHTPLRQMMEELYEMGGSILSNQTPQHQDLADLKERVVNFVTHLEPHSELEEGLLFPLLGNYIGRETGPIAVMEYEHDQAKKHLKLFLDQTDQLERVEFKDYNDITDNVIQAYHILTDHFMKEENVLFPLAEKMLSDEEKVELQEKIEATE
jgi:regulator of cell morphogenesis and NO signaling